MLLCHSRWVELMEDSPQTVKTILLGRLGNSYFLDFNFCLSFLFVCLIGWLGCFWLLLLLIVFGLFFFFCYLPQLLEKNVFERKTKK